VSNQFLLLKKCAKHLGGGCETETVVLSVEDGVVLSDEDITKDPEGSKWCWYIKTDETGETDWKTSLAHLENIFIGTKSEVLSVDGESDIRHGGEVVTINHVFTVDERRSTDGQIDLLDLIRGTSQERGSGISNSLTSSSTSGCLSSNGYSGHVELPVSLL